jgi:hypothetical protein
MQLLYQSTGRWSDPKVTKILVPIWQELQKGRNCINRYLASGNGLVDGRILSSTIRDQVLGTLMALPTSNPLANRSPTA